jgi:hypothetical protein
VNLRVKEYFVLMGALKLLILIDLSLGKAEMPLLKRRRPLRLSHPLRKRSLLFQVSSHSSKF